MALACGCASTGVNELKRENSRLTAQVEDMKLENAQLQKKVDYLSDVRSTLQREKGARISETSKVRAEARQFVRSQIDALRDFSQAASLLDYIGSEPLDRARREGEGLLLVDLSNRPNANGTLVGGKLFSQRKTRAAFCILRPSGDKLVTVWKSQLFWIPKEGLFKLNFDTPVAIEKNDVIALYCPSGVSVPFDVGTGDTRIIAQEPTVGATVPVSALKGREKRTYSFGVIGFME
jgi:hypothetical protein